MEWKVHCCCVLCVCMCVRCFIILRIDASEEFTSCTKGKHELGEGAEEVELFLNAHLPEGSPTVCPPRAACRQTSDPLVVLLSPLLPTHMWSSLLQFLRGSQALICYSLSPTLLG